MIIIVKYGQSLMDLAIQLYGSAAALVDLANDNALSLDAEVQPGDELIVQDNYPERATSIFAEYIKQNTIVVVSGERVSAIEVLITNDGEVISTNNDNGLGI